MDTSTLQLNQFALLARSGLARRGRFMTAHGAVETPAFMPVGTQAAVKAVTPQELSGSGARMLISNTYHLWLRPGAELVAELGGIHRFMGWEHAIATDSGGFQAFSLASRVKLTENGFEFSSHLDGARMRLTPEESMRVQGLLGSDIALQLDVCAPAGVDDKTLVDAMATTTRWGERCLTAKKAEQALFCIVQGGTNVDFRLRHAEELAQYPYDGIAMGGFSVGEPNAAMHETLAQVVPRIDSSRPRYLMGVGTPVDLIRAIGVGVDVFDCVIPTRNARNGQAFARSGKIVIKNAKHARDPAPLEAGCQCPACATGVSRGYLRHLYIANEILAHRYLTLHNLQHYADLVTEARTAIETDTFEVWASARLHALPEKERVPSAQPGRGPLERQGP